MKTSDTSRRYSGRVLKSVIASAEGRMILIVSGLILYMSFASPYFFTVDNFISLAVSLAEDSLLVVGMALLMISGVFDLSIGATLAFAGVCAAKLVLAGVPPYLAFAIAIGAGGCIGCIIGIIVAYIRVNALIASLGMSFVIKGLTLAVTQGFPVSMMPQEYSALGQGEILGVPKSIVIMVVVVATAALIMKFYAPARAIYYLGGNETAARLAGLPTQRLRVLLFTIMGVLAAAAGVIISSRLASAGVTFGVGTELKIIAATVIGGISLQGGKGNVLGAILGLLFLALVNNALILLGVSIYYQSLILGLILIAAVILDRLQDRLFAGWRSD